jgi:hypothetical protein
MLIIMRTGSWELISCPQSVNDAWALATQLTNETGVVHFVGRT